MQVGRMLIKLTQHGQHGGIGNLSPVVFKQIALRFERQIKKYSCQCRCQSFASLVGILRILVLLVTEQRLNANGGCGALL